MKESEENSNLTATLLAELRAIAARELAGESAGHTLEPTALVNEAWLKLFRNGHAGGWDSRTHFVGAAARAMRQVLVDHAKSRRAAMRDDGRRPLSLTVVGDVPETEPLDVIALHSALERLAERDPRKAEVVELRFFGGLTLEEIAEVLEVTRRTIDRDWVAARAWLYEEMRK